VAKGCTGTDLGLIGDGGTGVLARVNAINRAGTYVVGTRQTQRPNGPDQPFWQSTQNNLRRVDLPGLGGSFGAALGITIDGKRITGYSYDKNEVMFGVLWESVTLKLSTELLPLQAKAPALVYGGTSGSFLAGTSANDKGERAVKWTPLPNTAIELQTDKSSSAVAVNSGFDILGTNFNNGAAKCALWLLNGNRVDFGTLKFPDPKAINDSRLAVGQAMTPKGNHAILWDLSDLKNIQEIDLNDQIDPKLGWVLIIANGINSEGQIVGGGTLNGKVRGFILVRK
jgi:uncharacterized membrane protein